MVSPIEWEITVVLLVAVVGELTQILSQLSHSSTEARSADTDLLGTFYLQHGTVLLRVLLAKLPDPCQGGDAAAFLTARLAERYKPYFLGMVGKCAGDPGTLKLGDVVIASATVRHDFGKLTRSRRFWRQFDFEHRRQSQKLNGHLTNEILRFCARYGVHGFAVYFGVISTGNQVTKVPGVFAYLRTAVMRGLAGDEYNRGLLGLEMEAHAVAYAAEESKIPHWLIVKGVSDFADASKSDYSQDMAVDNAFTVTRAILEEVITQLFLREPANKGIEEEEKAQKAFREGDVSRMQEAALKAYAFGRRSQTARRRYFITLTQLGSYDTARSLIADYRDSKILYDHVTRGLEATLLWRQGKYSEACRVLPNDVILGRRQLLYLRAMNELFLHEPLEYPAPQDAQPLPRAHIEEARKLLLDALKIEKSPAPWWIRVNLVFVLRLLEESAEAQEAAFALALSSIQEAINQSFKGGTPRLYLLFLFAVADRRDLFMGALADWRESRHIDLPLETVDMVYLRLRILEGRGLLPLFPAYWADICNWLHRVRTIGRLSRDETASAMQ